jgi:hypothetical protein
MDLAIESQSHSHSQLDSFFVQDRKRTGLACANGTNIGVGLCGNRIHNGTSTKHF